MKKMLPFFKYIIVTIVLILGIIYFSDLDYSKGTVDFRGFVNEITVDSNNIAHIKASDGWGNLPILINVKKNISIKDSNKNKITISDIHIGDMIDLDYKGNLSDSTKPVTAKWIKVTHFNH